MRYVKRIVSKSVNLYREKEKGMQNLKIPNSKDDNFFSEQVIIASILFLFYFTPFSRTHLNAFDSAHEKLSVFGTFIFINTKR